MYNTKLRTYIDANSFSRNCTHKMYQYRSVTILFFKSKNIFGIALPKEITERKCGYNNNTMLPSTNNIIFHIEALISTSFLALKKAISNHGKT